MKGRLTKNFPSYPDPPPTMNLRIFKWFWLEILQFVIETKCTFIISLLISSGLINDSYYFSAWQMIFVSAQE